MQALEADRQALIDARQRWASALSTGRPRWSRWQRDAPDGEATPATHRTADKACFENSCRASSRRVVTPGGCAGPQRRAPRLEADSSEVCSSTSDEEDRVFAQQASRGVSLAPRHDASSACHSSGRPSARCLADASQETSLWPNRSSNGRADAAVMQRYASLVREDPEEHEQSTALRSTDRWDARTHGMNECSAAFSTVEQRGGASAEAGVQKLLASLGPDWSDASEIESDEHDENGRKVASQKNELKDDPEVPASLRTLMVKLDAGGLGPGESNQILKTAINDKVRVLKSKTKTALKQTGHTAPEMTSDAYRRNGSRLDRSTVLRRPIHDSRAWRRLTNYFKSKSQRRQQSFLFAAFHAWNQLRDTFYQNVLGYAHAKIACRINLRLTRIIFISWKEMRMVPTTSKVLFMEPICHVTQMLRLSNLRNVEDRTRLVYLHWKQRTKRAIVHAHLGRWVIMRRLRALVAMTFKALRQNLSRYNAIHSFALKIEDTSTRSLATQCMKCLYTYSRNRRLLLTVGLRVATNGLRRLVKRILLAWLTSLARRSQDACDARMRIILYRRSQRRGLTHCVLQWYRMVRHQRLLRRNEGILNRKNFVRRATDCLQAWHADVVNSRVLSRKQGLLFRSFATASLRPLFCFWARTAVLHSRLAVLSGRLSSSEVFKTKFLILNVWNGLVKRWDAVHSLNQRISTKLLRQVLQMWMDFNMECLHHRSWSEQTRQQANLERHQFLSSKRKIQQAFSVWLSCMYLRKHHAFIAKQIQLKSLEKRYRLMFASWNAGSVLEVWKLWHSLCRITSRTRRYKNLLMRANALLLRALCQNWRCTLRVNKRLRQLHARMQEFCSRECQARAFAHWWHRLFVVTARTKGRSSKTDATPLARRDGLVTNGSMSLSEQRCIQITFQRCHAAFRFLRGVVDRWKWVIGWARTKGHLTWRFAHCTLHVVWKRWCLTVSQNHLLRQAAHKVGAWNAVRSKGTCFSVWAVESHKSRELAKRLSDKAYRRCRSMLLMCVLFWADVTASKEDLSRTLLLNRSQSCTDEEINKMQAIEMSKRSANRNNGVQRPEHIESDQQGEDTGSRWLNHSDDVSAGIYRQCDVQEVLSESNTFPSPKGSEISHIDSDDDLPNVSCHRKPNERTQKKQINALDVLEVLKTALTKASLRHQYEEAILRLTGGSVDHRITALQFQDTVRLVPLGVSPSQAGALFDTLDLFGEGSVHLNELKVVLGVFDTDPRVCSQDIFP